MIARAAIDDLRASKNLVRGQAVTPSYLDTGFRHAAAHRAPVRRATWVFGGASKLNVVHADELLGCENNDQVACGGELRARP